MKKRSVFAIIAGASVLFWLVIIIFWRFLFIDPLSFPVQRTERYRAANEYQQDYLYFCDFARDTHPAGKKLLGSKTARAEQLQVFMSLADADETAFKLALMRLAAQLQDSHTNFDFAFALGENAGLYLPVTFEIYDGRLYVTRAHPDVDRAILNGLVESLHGLPITELLGRVRNYFGCENDLVALGRLRGLLNGGNNRDVGLPRLLGLLPESDGFEIRVDGVDYVLPLISNPYYLGLERQSNPVSKLRGDDFYFDFLDEQTAYFQLNTMMVKYGEAQDYFQAFFDQVRERNIKKLIVDLRYNGGGFSTTGFLFQSFLEQDRPNKTYGWYLRKSAFLRRRQPPIAFFIKPQPQLTNVLAPKQRYRFEGDVYFLQGFNTYSAATIFACALKDNKQYLTVGESSSQRPDFYAAIWPFDLPNSRLVGYISTGMNLRPDRSKKDELVLNPDVHVSYLPEHSLSGRDPVLEWALAQEIE